MLPDIQLIGGIAMVTALCMIYKFVKQNELQFNHWQMVYHVACLLLTFCSVYILSQVMVKVESKQECLNSFIIKDIVVLRMVMHLGFFLSRLMVLKVSFNYTEI